MSTEEQQVRSQVPGLEGGAVLPAGIESLDFAKGNGLLPAVVQHAGTGAVLMLGYMNRDALHETFTRRHVVFFSRSKQRLWEKGETSGHFLELESVRTDCDRDTLLILAHPAGPACHLGTATCWGADAPRSLAHRLEFLVRLEQIVAQRIADPPPSSYTATLVAEGLTRIAQKVGEEGVELALAAVAQSDEAVIGEAADLLYHTALLLKAKGLSLAQVVAELECRHDERGAQEPV